MLSKDFVYLVNLKNKIFQLYSEEISIRMWTSTNGVRFHLTSPLDVSVVKGRITFFCNFNQTVFTKNKGMLKDNKPQATHQSLPFHC